VFDEAIIATMGCDLNGGVFLSRDVASRGIFDVRSSD
jgi:hypothetical protein